MRWTTFILFSIAACGGDDSNAVQDAPPPQIDAPPSQCQPQGAVGAFYRRTGNPRLIAGTHTFNDSKVDTAISDPDLLWDAGANLWHLYYGSPHGTFASPGAGVIRHATSTDLVTWTFDDAPALSPAASGWDSVQVDAASVAYNAAAPADRRFVMVYAGSSQTFPHAGYTTPDYAIGVAFSADGHTFTRGGTDGKVLDASTVYPGSMDGTVSDPEIVVANGIYHLFFSSFACSGTNCATVDAKGIAHATSTDGLSWLADAPPIASLLDNSSMKTSGHTQPSVIYDSVHCRWELWMSDTSSTTTQTAQASNMSGVFHATSTNGMSWTRDNTRDLVWDQTAPGEGLGLRAGADVAMKGTGRYMLYTGYDEQNVPATSTLPTSTTPVAGVMTLELAARDVAP